MAQYCHASHEVYHEGVAQRAHNLSPVPFGAAKGDERKLLPLLRHRFAESRAELLIVVSCKRYYQVMGMMLLVSQYGFAKLVPAGTPMQCHL